MRELTVVVKVSKFLNMRFANHYHVLNVSERATYDKQKYFEGRVTDFNWVDSNAPRFNQLYKIAKLAYNWLKYDRENVVVIHCNAGKGRTGSSICAILLYMGYF